MNIYFAADPNGIIDPSHLPQPNTDNTLHTAFMITFAIIGALVLLVAVLAGARYALSKGEPDNIQKAKNELKYALIGMIIVALAATIVNYVIDKL